MWNYKRVRRVYLLLGMNRRRKVHRRVPARVKVPLVVPERARETWSMDFMSDVLTSKRKFRTLNIIDDYNREAITVEAAHTMPAARVTQILERAIHEQGTSFLEVKLWYLFIPLIIGTTLYVCVIAAFLIYPDKGDFVLRLYNSVIFLPIVITHIVFGLLTRWKMKVREMIEYKLIRNLGLIIVLVGFADVLLVITSSNFPEYIFLVRSILYILLGLTPVMVIRYKYFAMSFEWQTTTQSFAMDFNGRANYSDVKESSSRNLIVPASAMAERKLLLDSSQHKEIYSVIILCKRKEIVQGREFQP